MGDINNKINNANQQDTNDYIKGMNPIIKEMRETEYQPDVKVAMDSFSQKRNIKGISQKKRGFTAPKGTMKKIRKAVAVVLSVAIMVGTGAIVAANTVENHQARNQIIEQYNGNIDLIKQEIRSKIANEFGKALSQDVSDININRIGDGVNETGTEIEVIDSNGNIAFSYSLMRDLDGGTPNERTNKSDKLNSIAEKYLGIEDERDAAETLIATKNFTDKRDLRIKTISGHNGIKSTVKDEKGTTDKGFEIGD